MTTWSRPGRPMRSASCASLAFEAAGLDWEQHVVIDERFLRPAEVDLLVGNRKGARCARVGAVKSTSREPVATMVEADMDLIRKSLR